MPEIERGVNKAKSTEDPRLVKKKEKKAKRIDITEECQKRKESRGDTQNSIGPDVCVKGVAEGRLQIDGWMESRSG